MTLMYLICYQLLYMDKWQQTSKGKSQERNDNQVEMASDDQDDTISIPRSSVDMSDSRHHRCKDISEITSTLDCQKHQKIKEKEHINLVKKHSEPLKLLAYKQEKQKPEVRSQILPQKSISFASTRSTAFLNPFQPNILSPPSSTNHLLLIFISIQPIKKIEITSIHLIERNVKHIANIHQFDGTHFVLATFQSSQDENYRCCVTYEDESLTRHPIAKSQPFQGASLTIIVRASLGMEEKRKSLNFAIFQSIAFLLDNVISKTHTVQKQLFPWFNQLYTHFCRVSDLSTRKILTTLQINKKQPRNSQYFLYFFKAVYREQALDLYQQHKLQQKMTFAFVCRIVNRNYPESQDLCNFYVQVNLRFAINHHYAYNSEEIKNLVYFNMGCQSPYKIYELFMKLAEVIPKGLIDIDKDIKPIFIDEATLTVADYIKLKGKYFMLMVEKRPAVYQANCLMQFIRDLLDIAVTKHEDQFEQEEKLFSSNLLNEMQRILKFPQLDLPKFYSKCKILKATSKHTVNLVDLTLQVLQERQAVLIKHYPVKMVLSLLIQPTSEFDLSLLNSIFSLKSMTTDQWVQVIRELVSTQRNPYNIEYIQQKFIEIYKEIDVLTIAEALDKAMASNRLKKSKTNEPKSTLIYRLFTIFTSQTKVSNCLTLKKLLDSCCILRDPFLKQAFLNRIFKEIQRNNSSEEYLLFVESQVCNFDAEYREKCLSYLAACREGHRQ